MPVNLESMSSAVVQLLPMVNRLRYTSFAYIKTRGSSTILLMFRCYRYHGMCLIAPSQTRKDRVSASTPIPQ